MTPYHVIVASNEMVYVWQYRTPVDKLTSIRGAKGFHTGSKETREQSFHIDDDPDFEAKVNTGGNAKPTNDIVCCITASANCLIIGRASGTLLRYSLPHMSMDQKYVVRCRPQLLALNCNASRVSIIDIHGIMTLFDLNATGPNGTRNPHRNHAPAPTPS